MALLWALAVLSLLPLLDAQSPECANLMTAAPISNATMDWVSADSLSTVGSCFPPWAFLCPPDTPVFSPGAWAEILTSLQRHFSASKLRRLLARSLSREQLCPRWGGTAQGLGGI